MSFKMIREAQMLARLGENAKHALQIQAIIGAESVVNLPILHEGTGPQPSDFSTWLTTLVDHAADAGIDINNKSAFQDLAHEMFDNDPTINVIGGGTAMRNKCADMLWAQYKMNKAHAKVQDHVASTIKPGMDGAENEEKAAPTKAPLLSKALGVKKSGKTNPYPAGTLRAALWDDLHAGAQENEEEDPEMDGDDQDVTAVALPSPQDDVDPEGMSPDELAIHITGKAAMPTDDDEGGDDIEGRLDDLEQRVSDIEGSGDDVGNDELLDQERENNPEMDEPKATDADDDTQDDGIDQMGDDQYDDEDGSDDPIADVRNKPESEKPRAFQPGARFQEDEEFTPAVTKTLFKHAITQPKQHMAAALKDEQDAGAQAWMKMELPKNPHPKDSPAHKAWMKGMRDVAAQALGINLKPKEAAKKPAKKR